MISTGVYVCNTIYINAIELRHTEIRNKRLHHAAIHGCKTNNIVGPVTVYVLKLFPWQIFRGVDE